MIKTFTFEANNMDPFNKKSFVTRVPWSKKHKAVTGTGTIIDGVRQKTAPCNFSLSNSFAQPLTNNELIKMTLDNGHHDLVDEYNNHSLEYTPNGGSWDLRKEIARLYGSPDTIKAENILVFAGAQVALQHAVTAVLRSSSYDGTKAESSKKDYHAIAFVPGYQSTVCGALYSNLCAHVTEIRLKPETGWQIDPAEVKQVIEQVKQSGLETRYMVLNEPYNPAGTLMDKVTLAQLLEIADQNKIWVLCDEVYRGLEHDSRFDSLVEGGTKLVEDGTKNTSLHFGESEVRLPPIAAAYRRGISVSGLSKPWGGCGITIGWVALTDLDVMENLVDEQYFGTACPSRASELQALMVLKNSWLIMRKNLSIIRRNLGLLEKFLERHREFFDFGPVAEEQEMMEDKSSKTKQVGLLESSAVKIQAGAICFLRFKGPLTTEELGAELAAGPGVSIKPAYCFTDKVRMVKKEKEIAGEVNYDRDCSQYFRLGFGEEKMPRALDALEVFVRENSTIWRTSGIE